MSATKHVREKLGFTQETMAQWLGLSRSAIANYERGRGSLPSQALIKLGKLELMMIAIWDNKFPTIDIKSIQNAQSEVRLAKAKREFELYAKKCSFKANRLRKKLNDMQVGYIRMLNQMEILNALMKEKPATPIMASWFRLQYNTVEKKLKNYDQAAQIKLKLMIAMMETGSKMNTEL